MQKNDLGSEKFKVPKFFKAALHVCLEHGNADVERSFSENKQTITKEGKLLSEESISGLYD